MRKATLILLLLFTFEFVYSSQINKKEDKSTALKATTNILEYIQLFKSFITNALSQTDLASVRSLFKSPLGMGAYAVSILLGGIALMAFYESPLSPLPVPPLPHPPVGRFPPENPIWPPNRLQRLSTDAMHFLSPEQENFLLRKQIQRGYSKNHIQAQQKKQNNLLTNNVNLPMPNSTNVNNINNIKKEKGLNEKTNLHVFNANLLAPASSMAVKTFTHPNSFNPQALPSSILNIMRTLPSQDKFNLVKKNNLAEKFETNARLDLQNSALSKDESEQLTLNGQQQHIVHKQLNQVEFSNSPELTNLEKNLSRKE